MSSQTVQSVVIVGGGTAGWLTACTLAKKLGSVNPEAVQVKVIESPDIPTIGVGEGTWPTMRRTLQNVGVSETDFIKQCSATFKQGTQFRDWGHDPQQGQARHRYYNLFSSVYDPGDFNLAPFWTLGDAGQGLSYADAVSAQGVACEQNLAPKKITSPGYEAIQSYAYHLDAGEFAELLKQHAVSRLGVEFLPANVTEVNLDEDGYICSVNTPELGPIGGDLFVDCSGFSSLLLGQALKVPFTDVGHILHTDTAMAIQVPYTSDDDEIACVTRSTAQEAGWIWDIGLQTRRGIGHVYCSAWTSDEQAEHILRGYAGPEADDLPVRKIKMRIGHREKFWQNNCVAIGLSAAFVEPLEASAIFLVEAAGNMLSDLFPQNRQAMRHAAKQFNQSFLFRWSRTIDFIKMHYVLSKRESEFWRHNRDPQSIPDTLLEQLEAWQHRPVSKYDFTDINEPFPHESYQYILHGMGYAVNAKNFANMTEQRAMAAQYFANVERATKQICLGLPGHRELLQKINQFGLPEI